MVRVFHRPGGMDGTAKVIINSPQYLRCKRIVEAHHLSYVTRYFERNRSKFLLHIWSACPCGLSSSATVAAGQQAMIEFKR
jgi:hypothetical protein